MDDLGKPFGEGSEKMKELYRLLDEVLVEVDSDKAIVLWTKFLRLNPSSLLAYKFRGIMYLRKEEKEKALDDFSKVIELDPNNINDYNAEMYYLRGIIYSAIDEKGEIALRELTRAIDLDPNNSNAYYLRGFIYSQDIETFKEAFFDFDKAIELAPNNPELYITRGRLHDLSNDKEKAKDDYVKVLELDPENTDVYDMTDLLKEENKLGIKRRVNTACLDDIFKKAFESEAELDELIEKAEQECDDEKAIELWSNIIKLDHSCLVAYDNRADLYCVKEETSQNSIDDYSKVIELDPYNANGLTVSAYITRGFLYALNEETEYKTFNDFSKAIDLDPLNESAYAYRGDIMLKTKKPMQKP